MVLESNLLPYIGTSFQQFDCCVRIRIHELQFVAPVGMQLKSKSILTIDLASKIVVRRL